MNIPVVKSLPSKHLSKHHQKPNVFKHKHLTFLSEFCFYDCGVNGVETHRNSHFFYNHMHHTTVTIIIIVVVVGRVHVDTLFQFRYNLYMYLKFRLYELLLNYIQRCFMNVFCFKF